MKKKDDSTCFLYFFVLGLVAVFGYQIWRFFRRPDAFEQLLETVQALGICFGIILFVFLLFIIVPSFSRKKLEKPTPKKEYLVKCLPIFMEWRDETSFSKSLHEVDNQEKRFPVYIIVSVDNYGLYISNITSKYKFDFVSPETNEDRYCLLSNNRPNPITIITPHYELFYFLFNQRGDFKIEWRPSEKTGSSGLLPQNINQNSVEIVIVYGSIEDPNNKLQPIYRDPPLKLDLIVINSKGEYDLPMTCELYNVILAAKNSSYASGDDYY
jgi:hypothetical protein